jgi:hypothetical protein
MTRKTKKYIIKPRSTSNVQSPPPITTPTPNNSPTFMDTVKQGFGIGLGAEVGRKVVDKVIENTSSDSVTNEKISENSMTCEEETSNMKHCLMFSNSFNCNNEIDTYTQCVKNNINVYKNYNQ